MMTSVFVTTCLRLTWYIVLMSGICGNTSFTTRQSIFSHSLLSYDQDWFKTTSILSLSDCGKLCETVTGCLHFQYRFRGHICELNHYTGTTDIPITDMKSAGYLSWKKELFAETTNSIDQCTNCNNSLSCMLKSEMGECSPFACGNPYRFGMTSVFGNIQTLGGKIMYACLKSTEDMCFSECSNDGVWSDIGTFEGYEDYEIDGKSFKLKMSNVRVNKSEALKRCANEGASLTNLLTMDKLEFFRGISDKIPGEFWIDLERLGEELTLWTSSDGRNHTIDTSLWYKYNEMNKKCARTFKKRDWLINDFKCDGLFNYICEKSGY